MKSSSPSKEKQLPRYPQHKLMRRLERVMTRLEGLVNRLAPAGNGARVHNPLYHLGTLTIFLLIVLTVTGVFLTILYRPGAERAYMSVAGISANWFGSLVRSVHRYASDLLIVATLLHALKMLLADRFWGSRWLAWISGWLLLLILWLLGLMGYWLVWDETAQWLTHYFVEAIRGQFAYAFFGPNLAASTFTLFVIVLFLHVFVPLLLVVGIMVHVLRLSRARYWAPRWLMVLTVATLVLVASLKPVASALPADLNRILLDPVPLDGWYQGFLSVIQRVGGPALWGISFGVVAILAAIPWSRPGMHDGPALVLPGNCTGCAVCARECPFEAIEMVQRDDETPYSSIAVVNPARCTGCGICVGACPDSAIELVRLHSRVVRQDLQRTLGRASAAGNPPVTVFVCDRHQAMGTLPPMTTPEALPGGAIPLLQAKMPPRVSVGTWPDSQGHPRPVVTATVPCMGMLHPNWAAEMIDAGGAGVIVVGCPSADCSFREGPYWVADRLKRRRTFRKGNTHFLEAAPGSRHELLALWAKMTGDEAGTAQASQAPTVVGSEAARQKRPAWRLAGSWLAGSLVLLLAIALSLAWRWEAVPVTGGEGQLRLVINHSGQLVAGRTDLPPDVLAKLPDNVDPTMVLGGERYPVRLRLSIDGRQVLEQVYEPRGLRHEGSIFGLDSTWLEPGEHQVQVWLMDDEQNWRPVFDGPVEVEAGRVRQLFFDEEAGLFTLR